MIASAVDYRLAVGEKINLMEGLTTEEMVEYIEEKELKANTQMLEIIGIGACHVYCVHCL